MEHTDGFTKLQIENFECLLKMFKHDELVSLININSEIFFSLFDALQKEKEEKGKGGLYEFVR